MPARVRSVLARVGAAVLIVLAVAFGPAVGDGLRGGAFPLPSAAPRMVGPTQLAPTRAECRRQLATAATEPVPRPPAPFGMAVLQDRRGGAMDPFYRALSQAAAGRGVARIMYFGDSHVATDGMTGRIRHNLQSRFGNAGVGFVMPAKPLRWYSHADVEIAKGSGWDVLAVRKAHDLERRVGPAGFALFTHGTAWSAIRMRNEEAVDRRGQLQVFYLQQPAGGRARVVIDGEETRTWSTTSEGMLEAPGYFETALERTPMQLEIGTLGDGPVTIYGLTLERNTPGVVLDTLGIPGARAKDHLLWDDDMYREHLAKRAPDLVVLAYGTNEGTDTNEPLSVFEHNLRHVILRVHEAVPQASCLLIGPTDHPQRVPGGRGFRARKRTQLIVEAERRIAAETSCGFIDLVAVMGGPMSMMRLVSQHFAGADRTHFTRRGYEALADAISGAMVTGYSNWRREVCDRGD